jgi:hypothetical protein
VARDGPDVLDRPDHHGAAAVRRVERPHQPRCGGAPGGDDPGHGGRGHGAPRAGGHRRALPERLHGLLRQEPGAKARAGDAVGGAAAGDRARRPADEEGPFSDTDEPLWQGTDHAVENDWYGGRDRPWSRQHPGIEIDEDKDGISDQGHEVYSFLRASGVSTILVMGVHTNMCVLHRTFGIKQMTRWGMDCVLLRDLTDAMYSPARPPYVSHDEGTQLVVRFIEKFWCPSALGAQILSLQRKETERWTQLHEGKSKL